MFILYFLGILNGWTQCVLFLHIYVILGVIAILVLSDCHNVAKCLVALSGCKDDSMLPTQAAASGEGDCGALVFVYL